MEGGFQHAVQSGVWKAVEQELGWRPVLVTEGKESSRYELGWVFSVLP